MPVYPGAPDRLDPPAETVGLPVLVGVDEADYLFRGRSSSALKKAAAAFRISLARRSSRFSRSSSAILALSFVGTPGRRPSSTSALAAQWRSVSGSMPSWRATRLTAP